jgi:protein farnesyltransferase subunit beta
LVGTDRDPFDVNPEGIPFLAREEHIRFLEGWLNDPRPAGYAAADATRPFMIYWALIGLYLLGEDISKYGDHVINTIAPMQNPTGGFGGGFGQPSHSVTNYSAVLSLVASAGTRGLEIIDRVSMWRWMTKLKQPDGSFRLCEDGETDVRGAYCALTVMALLNLPWDLPNDSPAKLHPDDNLLTRLPEWLASCQTYEGGLSGSPNSEAHGAYAFNVLAALSILDDPRLSIPKYGLYLCLQV